MFAEINISINKNCLLCDSFDTIKKYNPELYIAGQCYKIIYNKKEVGIAELVAVKNFYLFQIKDELSYRVMGNPTPYLGSTLSKMYGSGQPLPRDFKLMQLVFQFKKRNKEITKYLVDNLIENLNQKELYG